jgi:hypothetical protein
VAFVLLTSSCFFQKIIDALFAARKSRPIVLITIERLYADARQKGAIYHLVFETSAWRAMRSTKPWVGPVAFIASIKAACAEGRNVVVS